MAETHRGKGGMLGRSCRSRRGSQGVTDALHHNERGENPRGCPNVSIYPLMWPTRSTLEYRLSSNVYLAFQVDGDGDGVVNPNEFLTLAKRTLRRAQIPIASPPARQNGKYPYLREKSGRHRATTKGGQGGNEEQASARLKAADPHGLGRMTFSQCFEHLLLS